MSKEQWIMAHEQLIAKYMMAHPSANWFNAYDATIDSAQERMGDNTAAIADQSRD